MQRPVGPAHQNRFASKAGTRRSLRSSRGIRSHPLSLDISRALALSRALAPSIALDIFLPVPFYMLSLSLSLSLSLLLSLWSSLPLSLSLALSLSLWLSLSFGLPPQPLFLPLSLKLSSIRYEGPTRPDPFNRILFARFTAAQIKS